MTTEMNGQQEQPADATSFEDAVAGSEEVKTTDPSNDSANLGDGHAYDSAIVNGLKEEDSSNPTDKQLKFFVGGIHPECSEMDVRRYFTRFGEVKFVDLKLDSTSGFNRGFAFVTMMTLAAKESVFQASHKLRGKKIDVREMNEDTTSNVHRKVFVGGVSPSMDESRLADFFSQFGDVEKATIIKDGNKPRGFAFVVYMDESGAKKCLQQKFHELDPENKVEVRQAEVRKFLSRTFGMNRVSGFMPQSPYGMSRGVPHVGYGVATGGTYGNIGGAYFGSGPMTYGGGTAYGGAAPYGGGHYGVQSSYGMGTQYGAYGAGGSIQSPGSYGSAAAYGGGAYGGGGIPGGGYGSASGGYGSASVGSPKPGYSYSQTYGQNSNASPYGAGRGSRGGAGYRSGPY